jgi:beta-glucosidase
MRCFTAAGGVLMVGVMTAACRPRVPASTEVAAPAPAPAQDWSNRELSPDERAELLKVSLTEDEKLRLVTSYFGVRKKWNKYWSEEARPQSAGFVAGVPRVGFPPQWQTDAGSGVATQDEAPAELERTLLPSGISTAATWNPALAERAGAMIGSEARASGFNVMLAGGVNLMRDPGNGRNFEYGGEDPLLAGTMVGALVRGIQSNHIVSTLKHFAFNDQESGRSAFNAVVDEPAARISDLLAFQLAVEQGDPGSIMCSYNRVNGEYACQNDWLLNQVLKRDWGFTGYVMTDWGAQHDTVLNANHGLDQETGVRSPESYQFLDRLSAAIKRGAVDQARLDDMVRRIARTLIAKGVIDDPVAPGPIDFPAHARVTRADAEEGIVLLQNTGGVLPLTRAKSIAVIGGHADVGVLTGGGSAQVYAPGGNAVRGLGPARWPGPHVYAKSSPLEALKAELPSARIDWADGSDLGAASALAAKAEVALVFVTQWTAEARDFPLTLPDDQDRLVDAVARANHRTVVILETGGPVLLPWIERVAGVVEAWYPGSQGGPAIARVLSGAVNPSGRLPVSFPAAAEQLPRPAIIGFGAPKGERFEVKYDEGAAVGYRWYDKRAIEPAFAFGHGLSYTSFAHDGLAARVADGELRVSLRVRNVGSVPGKDVAQIYVSPAAGGWEAPKRLGAFGKVELAPGEAKELEVGVDPRLLAVWDGERHAFHVIAGEYKVTLARSARDAGQSVAVTLPERWLPAGAGPTPRAPAPPGR